ncbi:multidrug resistance protein MdtO [Roseiarcus fermentans]|uniref:Multidrug resistance protein MdtO n=1 Tax=Roseiarcus fermentans TaxID=1473586 RepID=A0A366F217_9HYPH|nr:FUSC family protein [Roseiarcus fermentans]RBP08703.1 multidrug resistance protein MdtO [Roseiarcus fermentans]
MAPPAADREPPRLARLADLLAPFPGRLAFALRLAAVSALVALITEVYQTPEPWLAIYLVFFIMKPDRTASVLGGVVMTALVTLLVGFLFLIAAEVVDDPLRRVVAIAVLSFGLLFLGSASKLKPVASTIALVVVYALDKLGSVPSGEIATRALLYAWLFVGIPAAVSIVVSVAFGPSPRRLVERALAHRLRLAAAMLGAPDARARQAFEEALREGPGEVPARLRLAGVERTPPTIVAALAEADRSTAVILELIGLADRAPGAEWPASVRADLSAKLADMADILDSGGYPVDVDPGADDPALPPLAARALQRLRGAMATFAEPPPPDAAAESTKEEHSGFFRDDAFTDPAHVYFALKTTAAALFCYFVYSVIDWPGIHTCLITCYVVALETTAETIEKITLRIAGCLIGAAVGLATLVFVMPHLESIGALMAIVFAGALASAWISAGSPRIGYVGFQLALAFYICVAQGSGPSFDMSDIRDRIVGILFGELVVAAIFTSVRPVSVAAKVDRAIPALARRLAALAAAASAPARRALVAAAQTDLDALAQDLAIARYEPKSILPSRAWFDRRRETVAEMRALPAPMLLLSGPGDAVRWRLERIADAFSGVPVPADAPPQGGGAAPDDDAAAAVRALIDGPLTALEQIAAQQAPAPHEQELRHAPA